MRQRVLAALSATVFVFPLFKNQVAFQENLVAFPKVLFGPVRLRVGLTAIKDLAVNEHGLVFPLPGLLVLVPAAIGMRGNIFGALGSRFGTYVHTGTFRPSFRRETIVGQNIYAVTVLTFVVSGALAVTARWVSGGRLL